VKVKDALGLLVAGSFSKQQTTKYVYIKRHVYCICVVLLCVFTFFVPCCDVHYDFRIKMMFGSSLPPDIFRRVHVLLVFVYI